MYYEIWQQFDPDGTQYIRYQALSDFLDVLEPPLQIHKPNKYKIISMDIPICKGDLCYCVDVLDALTKDFFARKGNPVEETAELGEVTAHTDRPGYEPISSTLWRQREDYCARLIQHAWKRRGAQDEPESDEESGKDAASIDSDSGDERTPFRAPVNGAGAHAQAPTPAPAGGLTGALAMAARSFAHAQQQGNGNGAPPPKVNLECVNVVVHPRTSSVSSSLGSRKSLKNFDQV